MYDSAEVQRPLLGLNHACHSLVHDCMTGVDATDLCTPVLEVSKRRLKLLPAEIGDCNVSFQSPHWL
jgi:hypothetical protein